jgi:hypothetical protein
MMFLLFCYDQYYPCGGWGDHNGTFQTFEDALDAAATNRSEWKEIVRLDSLGNATLVWEQ